MTTETTETIPQFLTEADATILRAAIVILKNLRTASGRHAWTANPTNSNYLGRLSEAADIARFTMQNVLTCSDIYCGQTAASGEPETAPASGERS